MKEKIKEIIPVKEFNRRQQLKFDRALTEWHENKRSQPQRSIYFYHTRQGDVRKKGWIGLTEFGSI